MIDPSLAITAAMSSAFAALTYRGRRLALYDMMAPDTAMPPYVILGPWLGKADNSKGRFGQSGEITMDVVTRFTGGAFSKRDANEIANSITLMLSPRPGSSVLTVPGFSCWNLSIGPSEELMLNSASDIVFRKLITINLSLTQLTL